MWLIGRTVCDSGQYVSVQRPQWAGVADFDINKAKTSFFCTISSSDWQPWPNSLSVGAFVTRDIDQISVSVGPALTRDYRIDRNGTVYNFEWFVGHASQPILADTGNNFVLILVVFGDLSEKWKKSRGDESFEIVQYSVHCCGCYIWLWLLWLSMAQKQSLLIGWCALF